METHFLIHLEKLSWCSLPHFERIDRTTRKQAAKSEKSLKFHKFTNFISVSIKVMIIEEEVIKKIKNTFEDILRQW